MSFTFFDIKQKSLNIYSIKVRIPFSIKVKKIINKIFILFEV